MSIALPAYLPLTLTICVAGSPAALQLAVRSVISSGARQLRHVVTERYRHPLIANITTHKKQVDMVCRVSPEIVISNTPEEGRQHLSVYQYVSPVFF